MLNCATHNSSLILTSSELCVHGIKPTAMLSAHKKAHKTLDLECVSMTYGVVRAFQVIVNTLLCSPEKAGVGGSTPSLPPVASP